MTIKLSILAAFTAYVIIIIGLINLQVSPAYAFLQYQDQNEDVFFGLIPKALGNPYRMSGITPDEGISSVFFESEPIILELVVANHTKRSIPIAGKKGRWINLIEWQIHRNGTNFDFNTIKIVDRSAETKLNSFGRPMSGNSVDVLSLGVGEGIKKEISLVSSSGATLPFGKYKVSVLLMPSSLGNQFPQPNRAIPAEADFIVKKIVSPSDRLGYYSHLVQRHFITKEYDKARSEIKQMLSLNPNSIFAYTMLGDMYCEQGEHQQAAESFKKCITILEHNLDNYHRYSDQKHLREGLIASLKEKLNYLPTRCGKRR
jgi:tetratricopeptide (TPR) repeat protein